MKRSLLTAVAVLALAGPLAISSASAQPGQGRDDRPNYDGRPSYDGGPQQSRERDARDDDYRERREEWRDRRADAQWDESRYNGFYENDRWTYGQPSPDRYRQPGFSLGYRPWAVGMSLGYYNDRFQAVDYRQENLRRPARGLRWVRDDRGDFLLVSRSGRISQIIISGSQPRDRRQAWRDANAQARWDDARHNGYYSNNRWTYGQPPPGARVTLGYKPWQAGEQLGYYNGRYAVVDYRSHSGLRAPPRGHHWVRTDGGDYLLAAIAGGLIAQVVLSNTR